MKKQGAEINNIINALIKIIFRPTKGSLKFKVKQEDLIKDITS